MNVPQISWAVLSAALLTSCTTTERDSVEGRAENSAPVEKAQVPTWSEEDLNFFLHGSMSTEVVPELVLRAFIRTYPDLFPSPDLRHLGLIPDRAFGWPVGFSRRNAPHLGGLPSLGLNCASCHVGEVTASGEKPRRVLGGASNFDAEGYFGSVIASTFRTTDPAKMKLFLSACLSETEPAGGENLQATLAREWQRQEQKITAEMIIDPFGSKGVDPGALHSIRGEDLRLDHTSLAEGQDLAATVRSFLKLFHNVRAALHVPHQPPEKAPPASGPGRNDAFGLLSLAFFGVAQSYAPVKYGLVWNVENRRWVHWDGNTRSPIARNLLAALGLGAPLNGKRGELDFAQLRRMTELSERIRAPHYPFGIDHAAARRGAAHYQTHCASCHDGPEADHRLYTVTEIKTDGLRPEVFTPAQAERLNKFLADLEIPGYQPSKEPGIRSTQKLWAASLAGVWARSPYLHNGSVRTMQELLAPSAQRPASFHRGSRVYDVTRMGYTDAGRYVLDTTTPGNSNRGHDFGIDLTPVQKQDLIEFLKTL